MYKAVEFMTSNPAAMVQQAGIVALRDGEPYIAELREHYRRRRDQVKTALAAMPGVSLPDPQGAFYAFPETRRQHRQHCVYGRAGARNRSRPGARRRFGRDGEGYIRVCFASTEATIADALDRLKKFVMSRRP